MQEFPTLRLLQGLTVPYFAIPCTLLVYSAAHYILFQGMADIWDTVEHALTYLMFAAIVASLRDGVQTCSKL